MFEENGQIQGYAMAAKSFSTEFGRPCIWVDMDAITDDLSHYMFAVKYSTYNAGSTVQDFRHTVV